MASGQLVFQPSKFDLQAEDQKIAFEQWKGQITLALRASNFDKAIWLATIVRYFGEEGLKRWIMLRYSIVINAI